ncbi:FMN reductase [Frateuria sp. Soil773]|uniref:NADPH-dependent FMN reductase n=1 Tax=Frateuria sp. Soil773 TaxID=1736407 RepID=UPI0006F284F3|nr:NAD(P)H-dependent oxidoreductase [Frateuria sp. Soil773]KRE89411.1 FMN reductase [Frateuria sp. Soil773]
MPTRSKINVALIYGSTREGRLCDKVAGWASRQVAQHGDFALDAIDPAALSLPSRHEVREAPELARLRQRLAWADAFVIVTPEYNHGYPASLKFLIDSVYGPWQAKPVAFVAYGGASGGLRAVEQLRPVFAELHAVTIRDVVSFAQAWQRFDADGNLSGQARAHEAMAAMLAQLRWWAVALRTARLAVPYMQAA